MKNIAAVQVYPIASYGSVEVALFTMVWKKDGSAWKLSRVLSYDHVLAK